MVQISSLIRNSNLSGKESFLLLVHDFVQTEKTGVPSLSEADKSALKNWKPKIDKSIYGSKWANKYNTEVNEYNKYHECWKMEGLMKVAIQDLAKSTQIDLMNTARSITLMHQSDYEFMKKEIQEKLEVSDTNSLREVFENTGINYSSLLLNLSAKDKAGLEKLVNENKLKLFEKEGIKYIHTEELFYLNSELEFIQEIQTQLESLKNFGFLLCFIKYKNPLIGYTQVLGFEKIYNKLSSIFEIDLKYMYNKWMQEIETEIVMFNFQILFILSELEQDLENSPIVIFKDNFLLKYEIMPDYENDSYKFFSQKVDQIFP